MLVPGLLGIDFHALEIIAHDEVDDAGDGVGTIDRRRTAGDHFDAFDQRGRDGVDIGGKVRTGNGKAPPIDQDQIARRTEVAQVQRRRADRLAGLNRVGRRTVELRTGKLRRVGQQDVEVLRPAKLQFLLVEDGHGRRRLETAIGQARPGHDDNGFLYRRGDLGRRGRTFGRAGASSLDAQGDDRAVIGGHFKIGALDEARQRDVDIHIALHGLSLNALEMARRGDDLDACLAGELRNRLDGVLCRNVERLPLRPGSRAQHQPHQAYAGEQYGFT